MTTTDTNIPDTHTQTKRFLFTAAQKLTRLASKQATESVINLFSLAPRSHGRGLIRGRELFCIKKKKQTRYFDSRAEAHHSHLQLSQGGAKWVHFHQWFDRSISSYIFISVWFCWLKVCFKAGQTCIFTKTSGENMCWIVQQQQVWNTQIYTFFSSSLLPHLHTHTQQCPWLESTHRLPLGEDRHLTRVVRINYAHLLFLWQRLHESHFWDSSQTSFLPSFFTTSPNNTLTRTRNNFPASLMLIGSKTVQGDKCVAMYWRKREGARARTEQRGKKKKNPIKKSGEFKKLCKSST